MTTKTFWESLTIDEQEVLCSLDLSNNDRANKRFIQTAQALSHAFENGVKTARDPAKAEFYAGKIWPTDPEPPHLKTQNAYALLGWYTSFRLAFIRAKRVIEQTYPPLFSLVSPVFSKLLSIGGLSYAIELIVDIGVIIHSVFWVALSKDEVELTKKQKFSYWDIRKQRFKNVLNKDDRLPRMANALVWLVINATCLALTGGLSGILNLIGFSFDVVNEIYKSWKTVQTHRNLFKKINDKIDHLESEEKALERELNENGMTRAIQVEEKEVEEKAARKEKLAFKIAQFAAIKTKLLEKVKDKQWIWDRVKSIIATTLLVVGMGLVFFPPTTLHGAGLIGGGLALGAGSMLGGLGARLRPLIASALRAIWRGVKNIFTPVSTPEKIPVISEAKPAPINKAVFPAAESFNSFDNVNSGDQEEWKKPGQRESILEKIPFIPKAGSAPNITYCWAATESFDSEHHEERLDVSFVGGAPSPPTSATVSPNISSHSLQSLGKSKESQQMPRSKSYNSFFKDVTAAEETVSSTLSCENLMFKQPILG